MCGGVITRNLSYDIYNILNGINSSYIHTCIHMQSKYVPYSKYVLCYMYNISQTYVCWSHVLPHNSLRTHTYTLAFGGLGASGGWRAAGTWMRSSEGMPYSSRLEASSASDSCMASCSATSSRQSASDMPGGGGPLRAAPPSHHRRRPRSRDGARRHRTTDAAPAASQQNSCIGLRRTSGECSEPHPGRTQSRSLCTALTPACTMS